MITTRSSNVYLNVPHGPDRDVLRAALLAIQGVPTNLPLETLARRSMLSDLELDPRAFVFLDISARVLEGHGLVLGGLTEALNTIPKGLRSRTVLTRVPNSYISVAERDLVQSLGFVDLVAEFDSKDIDGRLRSILNICSEVVGTPDVSDTDFSRYLNALSTNSKGAARLIVWKHTGLSVDALLSLFTSQLGIRDRTYHLKKYSMCFIASDAVAWMCKKFKIGSASAVAVGKALGSMGLIYHVEHEHQFSDDYFFFRIAKSTFDRAVDLGEAYRALVDAIHIDDRTYLGKTYLNCWVGSEAVDLICEKFLVPRYAAFNIMHWLEELGLFVHVAHEKVFMDGNFYYQFHHQLELVAHLKEREFVS
jgi:hypothetical protein